MIGVLYDSYGPFWILLAGTAAGTVSYMVLSVTNAIWQIFLLQGVMMGISIGCAAHRHCFLAANLTRTAASSLLPWRCYRIGSLDTGQQRLGALFPEAQWEGCYGRSSCDG